MKKRFALFAALASICIAPMSIAADPPAAESKPVPLTLKTIAEKKVTALPPGELFWRVENFDSLDAARKAGGDWSLAAEAGGRVWLFTLAPKGGASPGGTKRADVGPIRTVTATNYLLKVNQASGVRGAITPIHTHPGSEAFFVLAGEQSIRTPHGTMVVKAGQPEAGHGPGMPMQVSSSGEQELLSLVMFVVDADQPFAPPATF